MVRTELGTFFKEVEMICLSPETAGGGRQRVVVVPEFEFQDALQQTPNTIIFKKNPDQRDHIEWTRDRIDVDLRIGGEVRSFGSKIHWTPNSGSKIFQLGTEGSLAGQFYLLVKKNSEETLLFKEHNELRKARTSEIPESVEQKMLAGNYNPERWLG